MASRRASRYVMTRMMFYLLSHITVGWSTLTPTPLAEGEGRLVARSARLVAPGNRARAILLHMLVQIVWCGEGAFLGERGRLLDGCACALGAGAKVFVAGQASFFQLRLEQLDGITIGLPGGFLFARAVLRRISQRVTAEAIGDGLDQRWAFAVAGSGRRLQHGLAYGQHVHAIHLEVGHAIGGGARLQRGDRPCLLDVHAHRIAVVLAEV